jgi:hypothetical protein
MLSGDNGNEGVDVDDNVISSDRTSPTDAIVDV